MTFDTACSSGLMAVHLACRSLHDMKLTSLWRAVVPQCNGPHASVAASTQNTVVNQMVPLHSFDADADGFVRSEAARWCC